MREMSTQIRKVSKVCFLITEQLLLGAYVILVPICLNRYTFCRLTVSLIAGQQDLTS